MMRLSILIVMGMLIGGAAWGQTTQPTQPTSVVKLELRADAAFDRQDYAAALPLYIKLSQQIKDDATKLGAVQEKIRVCQKNISGKATPVDPSAIPGAATGAEIKTSPEERKTHVRPKDGEVLELPIKMFGNFDYDFEKGGSIPEDVKKLSGAKIRTNGFMIPIDQADKITQFALVPSLFACCFGQPPQVQHTMLVKTPKGKAVAYYPDEIIVEGILKVEETREDGIVVNVFEVQCISVKPAAK